MCTTQKLPSIRTIIPIVESLLLTMMRKLQPILESQIKNQKLQKYGYSSKELSDYDYENYDDVKKINFIGKN